MARQARTRAIEEPGSIAIRAPLQCQLAVARCGYCGLPVRVFAKAGGGVKEIRD